jgi:hypothetical protein
MSIKLLVKKTGPQVLMGALLLALSALVYLLLYSIFHDYRHTLDWFLEEIAFIPIQIFVVTLIIDRMLSVREKRQMINKLNMVIGVFFSEVGIVLISKLSSFNPQMDILRSQLKISAGWSDRQFLGLAVKLKGQAYALSNAHGDLAGLKTFLVDKRKFLLTLLENPNLLEHETFTELLWAVFHLSEELTFRTDLSALPQSDLKHIGGDMERAYGLLIYEWLMYMKHLKNSYPYLFSLAVRTNPFDPDAEITVKT